MSGHDVHLLAAAVILITVCSYNLQQINALTSEPECGVRNLISRRIIGGVEAEDHEFPWMVYLEIINKFFCGGAILDKRHILTAAHCLLNQTNTTDPTSNGDCYYQKREWKFNDLSQITVGFGSSDLLKQERYGVSGVNIDGRYVTETNDYDVAVVTLDRDLYNDSVKPICLPESGQEPQGACIIAGWGATEYSGSRAPQLRKTKVDIVNRTYCSEFFQWNIERNKVCAGILGKAGACHGDSGGPLVCKVDNRYFTFGITSFVRGNETTCSPEAPTVFTKVSNPAVLTFIKQAMRVY